MGLHQFYKTLTAAGCADYSVPIPNCYHTHFVNLGGSFEIGHSLCNQVRSGSRVLVVGVFAGRDYYFLQAHGCDVVGFDLSPQKEIHGKMVIGDVQSPLPFKNESFDAIVMFEVLEHLEQDLSALRHLRDILRDDGVLVISVPYFHDDPEHHLRIYSPRTIRRVLLAAGFSADRVIERPGLIRYGRWFFFLHHGIQALSYLVSGRVFYKAVLTPLSRLEQWLGERPFPIRRWSSGYGGMLRSVKSRPVDTRTMNKRDFSVAHEHGQH